MASKYTAHDNPEIDRTIARHLARIVDAIRDHLEPRSIILYGSFGRGEGSVMLDDGRSISLSDYEIAVVTRSPCYRKLFASLSRQLTAELGVETSISWMRPGRLRTNQSQNLSLGRAAPTIAMYELKTGGQTLYGREMLNLGPIIDPRQISVRAGIRLLINRMIESLPYTPRSAPLPKDRIETIRWINKLILACNEALLLLWGEYHYSYAERGRRFAALNNLAPGTELSTLVERATHFKLHPAPELYPQDLNSLWPQVAGVVDTTFRHLMAEELGITFETYAQFPERFLNHPQVQKSYNLYRLWPLPVPLDQKLINAIKYLRQRRLPPRGYWSHFSVTANLIVFALAPLLFLGRFEDNAVLDEVRRWLVVIGYGETPRTEPQAEWTALCRYLLWAWKNFCYN